MNAQEMKNAFQQYMDMAIEAKEPAKMQILADSYTRLFEKMAEAHPELAEATLTLLAPIAYRNYVTPRGGYEGCGGVYQCRQDRIGRIGVFARPTLADGCFEIVSRSAESSR